MENVLISNIKKSAYAIKLNILLYIKTDKILEPEEIMVTKTIMCSNCKNKITLQGVPREKISVTCPKCGREDVFTFPEEKTDLKTTNESYVIEVNSLTKFYNGFKAIDNLSFKVKQGEIFGFLGPNGAGKTTTIKAMLGLIHMNNGDIKINGLDITKHEKEIKKNIGYHPEHVALYDNLTALQNLYFYSEIKNAPKGDCMKLLEEFGLKESAHKRVRTFSKGMLQKLGVIRAIIGTPSLIILDEPTIGLDPQGVLLVREKIRELNKRGATVFISSHILSEVQEICDRIGIINRGILIAQDTILELSKKLKIKPKITVALEQISDKIVEAVKKVKGIDELEISGNKIEIICDPKIRGEVVLAIGKAGGNIVNLQTRETSLEEVFMKYIGG